MKFPSIDEARLLAYEKSSKYHEKNKLNFDKQHCYHQFKPNDLVYIRNLSGINKGKLDPNYYGPFRVLNKFATNIYDIVKSESPLIIEQIHSKHLVPIRLTRTSLDHDL